MKKFTIILMVLIAVTINAFAQYSNATLNGPWFLHTVPLYPYNDSLNYLVFDGNGNIIDGNMFCTSFSGNYSVTAGGAISGTLCGSYPFSGQLSSQNYATMGTGVGSGFVLSRITNPGALTDSLVGILDAGSCGQKNVTLRLNSQGQIISTSGLTLPVTGGVYADSGVFIGHLKTGGGSGWNEFSIMGYFTNDSLNGLVSLDRSGCDGEAHLKRFGVISGIIPISVSAPEFIVYPNPATDIVTININNANNDDMELNIYTVMGVLVKSEMFKQNHRQINIGDLSNGVYMVEIKSKELTEKQKLIIQR
jgi:predicted outer membrane repeat protein